MHIANAQLNSWFTPGILHSSRSGRKEMIFFKPAAILLIVLGTTPGYAAVTLITHATLISPERSEPLHDAWVRVEDGLIADIGVGTMELPGAEVINALNRYLIPGLIDSHVHLYHATGLKRRYTENFDTLYDAFMEQQPRSFLYHGFTSVIELNADNDTNARFEASSEHPRLFHCGQGVILSDGFMALELEGDPIEQVYPGFLIDHYSNGTAPGTVDPKEHTPEAAVDYIQQQGGRCVKLYYEEALWWPGEAPEFRLPSVAIARDVVEAAHALEMPVVLHATTPKGHAFALETGIDILAHGMWEWPDVGFAAPEPTPEYAQLAKQIAESKIKLQPTFSTLSNTASLFDPNLLADPAWTNVVPEKYLSYLQGNVETQLQTFLGIFGPQFTEDPSVDDVPTAMTAHISRYEKQINLMASNGANFLFGSDTAVGGFGWASPPGLAGYWEMLAWIKAGVTLESLFRALTLDNARAFELDNEIGSIEVGKKADLLILAENPLDSVMAYDTIEQVFLGGRLIERKDLSAEMRYPEPR